MLLIQNVYKHGNKQQIYKLAVEGVSSRIQQSIKQNNEDTEKPQYRSGHF